MATPRLTPDKSRRFQTLAQIHFASKHSADKWDVITG